MGLLFFIINIYIYDRVLNWKHHTENKEESHGAKTVHTSIEIFKTHMRMLAEVFPTS